MLSPHSQSDASTTSQALQQDVSALEAVKASYGKQEPSISQKLVIEQINKTLAIASINQQQLTIAQQLMNYVVSINFKVPTQSQSEQINSMEQQINTLSKRALNLAYKLNNNE